MTEQGLGQAMMALLAASSIAFILSRVLLARYRSRVAELIRASHGRKQLRETPAPGASPVSLLRVELAGETPLLSGHAGSIFAQTVHGPTRFLLIYCSGVGAFAAVMSTAYLAAEDVVSVTRWVFMFVVQLWPAVLVVVLLTPPASRTRKITVFGYAAVASLVLLIAALISPQVAVLDLNISWLVLNGPPTLILFLFMNRRVRAVGTLTLAFSLVSVLGGVVALGLLDRLSAATSNDLVLRLFGLAAEAGMSAIEVFVWFLAIGFLIAGALGWVAVRWLAHLYREGRVSDQSLIIDAMVLFVGIYHSIVLAYAHPIMILSGFVAYGLYRLVVNAGFRRFTSGWSMPATNLLYLRVFSLGKESENMFDAVPRAWRNVGNVQLIAGPDLATTTVEPHQFLDFLSGDFSKAFIADSDDLERRLGSIRSLPGRDLRFGVNEFFCYENTWRQTLAALAERDCAVLLDARGFSRRHSGVVFELNQLVNTVPVRKCVVAVDRSTDFDFLKQVVADAWTALAADSPNRKSQDPTLTAVSVESLGESTIRRLLMCLSLAAKND